MKMIKKAAALFAVGAICLSLISCAGNQREYTYICGKKISFYTEKEMEKWREPIENLIANTEYPIYSDDVKGELLGYTSENPDAPSIAYGNSYALYDVNLDGVPELLVNMGGGSAGNFPYAVYDIYTGENVCGIDGGGDGSICAYYFSETAEVKNVNVYSCRSGWSGKQYFTSVFLPGTYEETMYLYGAYSMCHDSEGNIVLENASFEVCGKMCDPESYFFEEEDFQKNCIRIKETEIITVYRWDASDDEDTWAVKGEKIANALLSSGQKFIYFAK